MSANEVNIDLAAIEAEVASMSQEDVAKALLGFRTQQKFQQKKNQNNPNHKAYQKKQQEKRKAMIALAKKLGIYDAIDDQADAAAEAKLKAEAETTPTSEEVAATT